MSLKYAGSARSRKLSRGPPYEVSRVNLSSGQIFNQSCPRGWGGGVQRTVQKVVCSHELTRVDVFYNVSSVGVYDY